jgi:hypothetical protein
MNKVLTPREARQFLEEFRLEEKRMKRKERYMAAPCYVYRNRADWLAGRYAYIM